jgi:ferredoxin
VGPDRDAHARDERDVDAHEQDVDEDADVHATDERNGDRTGAGTSTDERHAVTLRWRDGREKRVEIRADETVLDGAERRGVALPFGCRTGACATCTGRLREGELVYRRPPRALKPRHREAGYVLLCVAEPRSDCAIEVGAAVHSELVSNPWK